MIIVGAMSSNRVIGSGDGMPWDVPEEYDHFLRLVEGKTIIIGRKSYEIFGGNLSSRHNIVVSRSRQDLEGAIVVPSVERAMQVADGIGVSISVRVAQRSTRRPSRWPTPCTCRTSRASSAATHIFPSSRRRTGAWRGGTITPVSSSLSIGGEYTSADRAGILEP